MHDIFGPHQIRPAFMSSLHFMVTSTWDCDLAPVDVLSKVLTAPAPHQCPKPLGFKT